MMIYSVDDLNVALDMVLLLIESGQAAPVPKVSGFGALNGHYERSQVMRRLRGEAGGEGSKGT